MVTGISGLLRELSGSLMDRLELVPIWVEHKRSVVGLTVVRSKPRSARIGAAAVQCCLVKPSHRRLIWRCEGVVGTRPSREITGFGLFEERQLVVAPRPAVPDGAVHAPQAHKTQRGQGSIVKGLAPVQISHTEGDVAEHGGASINASKVRHPPNSARAVYPRFEQNRTDPTAPPSAK